MSEAHDARQAHLDFIEYRVNNSSVWAEYFRWMGSRHKDYQDAPIELGLNTARAFAQASRSATTYAISKDMIEMVGRMAETMPPEQLQPEDLMSPNGFLSLPLEAGRGREFYFIWGTFQDGIGLLMFSTYSRTSTKADQTCCWMTVPFHSETVTICNRFSEEDELGESTQKMMEFYLSFLRCMFVVMRQELGVAESSKPKGKLAQSSKRLRLKSEMRIIRLRRRARLDVTGECSPVEWSCQWLVNGHWRQQWYPSEKRHRSIWIAPYIKGPDDKPLVISDKVMVLDR